VKITLGALALMAVLAATLSFAIAPAIASVTSPSTQWAVQAAKKKTKKKVVRCKQGQARIRIGKRTSCVRNALPSTTLTPREALVAGVLGFRVSARDRHGRRAPSLSQLLSRLGPGEEKRLSQTIATGLTRGEQLLSFPASAAHTSSSPGAFAAVACGPNPDYQKRIREYEEAGPEAKEEHKQEYEDLVGKQSFQSGDMDASLDLANGAMKLGVNIKDKGIHLSVSLRTCGEGSFHLDSCPTAEGKVEGGDQTEIEFAIKATEGTKLVLSQGFKSVVETTLKGQTGDDGKLDYYDIKHVYEINGTSGGGQAKFGPITVDTTYIGEARVDMRGGNSKPPPAAVDVRISMAGADPAEAIAAEIKAAHDAQADADKEFSAEVDKVTDRMRKAETNWLTPKKCAKIVFEPDSKTLKLKKGQTGTFKARTEANKGGAPGTASWTLGAQQNATFSPASGEGNPQSTSYEVTKAKHELFATVVVKATSKAGVAEEEWKQETEAGITTVSGTFSGHLDDEAEVLEWSGTATFKVVLHPVGGTILQLISGEATVTASGEATGTGCNQTGKETVQLSPTSTFSVEGEGEPVTYEIVAQFGFPGRLNATLIECAEPTENGLPSTPSLGIAAVQSGDPLSNGPSDLIKSSTDGKTFAGSATATSLGPDAESYNWSWSFTGTE
jgi:hypothetical protein